MKDNDWLNDVMDLDHVVMVRLNGTVDEHPESRMYAPESLIECDEDGQISKDDERAWESRIESEGWEVITHGYSGQYGYAGPIMHASEYIGGQLADDILRRPGLYAAITVETLDDSEEAAGWTVVYRQVPVREPGYYDCPCCSETVISADGTDVMCPDCELAGCESGWDSSGDFGWWDCQRSDRDDS